MNERTEQLSSLVERIAGHVQARFASEGSGHDWHHIHRVWRLARQIAEAEGAPRALVNAVVEIVATISFKGAGVKNEMRSLEGKCVQDADRLDALGAIGIARCFAYGGHAGRLIYDPDVTPVMHATAEAYKSATGTSLNHFHEKLFLLKDRMNTATGRALAEERHRFMEAFVRQFLLEWGDA